MEDTRKPVFLSHKTEDRSIVEKVAAFLEENGIPCWYAPRDIPYGEHYNTEIPDALKNVESVLVFITERTAQSTGVPREVNIALNNNKRVMPIFIDKVPLPSNLEFFLCNTQWIEKYSYESEEEFLINLAGFLEELYQFPTRDEQKYLFLKQPVVYKDSSQSLLYQLPSTEIEQAEQVFIAPPEMEKSLEKLKTERILHISNPHHIGKYTYAISLLKSAGVEEIFEWSKEISLLQITKEKIEKNSGYIIEISGTSNFYANVHENQLEEFMIELRKRESFSIFIDKEGPPPLMNLHSISVSPPQNLSKMLIRHAEQTGFSKELKVKIIEWIDSENGKQMVPEQLYPRDANVYIQKIAKLVVGDISEQELVQSFEENIKKRVKAWFSNTVLQDNPQKQIAFYLSLTVYEGNSYSFIHEKAREIYSLLSEYEDLEPVNGSKFLDRDQYLSSFNAHAVREAKQTDVGKEEITAVRLIFKEDIPYIWRYIWEQYPMYNSLLVNWLRAQLFHNIKSANENVKNILLNLLFQDPLNIRTSVIMPLANSKNPKDRLFAAAILENYSKDEDRRHFVYNMVHSWTSLNNNNRLQWTALVLIGTDLHLSYFPQSLHILRRVYVKSEGKMAFSVQREMEKISRTALYSRDFETLYFRFWEEWLAASSTEEAEEVLKLVLSIFAKSPEIFFYAKTKEADYFFIKLVHHSLKKPFTRKSLEKALESWSGYSILNPKYKNKLVHLLFEVYTSEKVSNKKYLESFISKRVERNKKVYLPIQQQLINM